MILFFKFQKTLNAEDKTEHFFQLKSPLILIKLDSTFSFSKQMLEIPLYKVNTDCFKQFNTTCYRLFKNSN